MVWFGLKNSLQVYAFQDGTMVPVTVFHDKSVKMNGQNPMLLHVYGK